MKDETKIQDWRSTGRRIARRNLFKAREPYKCAGVPEKGYVCNKTSIDPPKDAPSWFDEIWPEENRVLTYSLQANHLSKDFTNNSVEFLSWQCQPCHKERDSQTDKGESTVQESWF